MQATDGDETRIAELDPLYARAIGTAVFAFAMLEAAAVRGCEDLQPGIMAELDDRTAGRVADTLLFLCRTKAPRADAVIAAATRFQSLVRSRNNLFHARPGRANDGATRLLRDGDAWSQNEIEDIAAMFGNCAAALSAALAEATAVPR